MPAPWPASGTSERSYTSTSHPASRSHSAAFSPPNDPPITTTRARLGFIMLPLGRRFVVRDAGRALFVQAQVQGGAQGLAGLRHVVVELLELGKGRAIQRGDVRPVD